MTCHFWTQRFQLERMGTLKPISTSNQVLSVLIWLLVLVSTQTLSPKTSYSHWPTASWEFALTQVTSPTTWESLMRGYRPKIISAAFEKIREIPREQALQKVEKTKVDKYGRTCLANTAEQVRPYWPNLVRQKRFSSAETGFGRSLVIRCTYARLRDVEETIVKSFFSSTRFHL